MFGEIKMFIKILIL